MSRTTSQLTSLSLHLSLASFLTDIGRHGGDSSRGRHERTRRNKTHVTGDCCLTVFEFEGRPRMPWREKTKAASMVAVKWRTTSRGVV